MVDKLIQKRTECAIGVKGNRCIQSDKIIRKLSEQFGGTDPDSVIEQAKKKLKCDGELCVIRNPIVQERVGRSEIEREIKERFKPPGPTKPPILLNNFDINNIMLQFERAFSSFIGVPFQMIDFREYDLCSTKSLYPDEKSCDCNLFKIDFAKKIKEGKKYFGVVINTDKHNKGGTHWFCLFGDFSSTPFVLEYFNSSGRPPMIEISTYLKDLAERITNEMGIPVIEKSNIRIEHQKDVHSCGVYALCYIYARLNGFTHEYFDQPGAVNDELMNKARKFFFNE